MFKFDRFKYHDKVVGWLIVAPLLFVFSKYYPELVKEREDLFPKDELISLVKNIKPKYLMTSCENVYLTKFFRDIKPKFPKIHIWYDYALYQTNTEGRKNDMLVLNMDEQNIEQGLKYHGIDFEHNMKKKRLILFFQNTVSTKIS